VVMVVMEVMIMVAVVVVDMYLEMRGGDVKPASLHYNHSVSVECDAVSEHCLHCDATQSEGHNSNMAPPDFV